MQMWRCGNVEMNSETYAYVRLLLAAHCSPLTVHLSLLTTHRSPLTILPLPDFYHILRFYRFLPL